MPLLAFAATSCTNLVIFHTWLTLFIPGYSAPPNIIFARSFTFNDRSESYRYESRVTYVHAVSNAFVSNDDNDDVSGLRKIGSYEKSSAHSCSG